MKKGFNCLSIGLISYAFILVIETLVELFSMGKVTGTVTVEKRTLLGVIIKNVSAPDELTTSFGLTLQAILPCIMMVSLIGVLTWRTKKAA